MHSTSAFTFLADSKTCSASHTRCRNWVSHRFSASNQISAVCSVISELNMSLMNEAFIKLLAYLAPSLYSAVVALTVRMSDTQARGRWFGSPPFYFSVTTMNTWDSVTEHCKFVFVTDQGTITLLEAATVSRGVHRNGNSHSQGFPMEFPWEWEYFWANNGNGNWNGNSSDGNGNSIFYRWKK